MKPSSPIKAAPVGFFSEILCALGLVGVAFSGLRHIRRMPMRKLFIRYYLLAGANSVGGVMTRAAVLGAVLIGYVINVIAADTQSAIHILVQVVLREGGPLFAALIVTVQGGIEVTGRFVSMRQRGEMDGLRLLGIEPIDFFGAPCLLGIAGATVMLTMYFNMITVLGGILLSSLITDLSVIELLERFLTQAQMGDIFYAVLKSALFGLSIGMVSCYQGLMAHLGPKDDGSRLVSRAVMQALFFISGINALAAYLARGIVLFGVVKI